MRCQHVGVNAVGGRVIEHALWQVPGWRIEKDASGALSLRQDWKVCSIS
jgi:hypothetical protein